MLLHKRLGDESTSGLFQISVALRSGSAEEPGPPRSHTLLPCGSGLEPSPWPALEAHHLQLLASILDWGKCLTFPIFWSSGRREEKLPHVFLISFYLILHRLLSVLFLKGRGLLLMNKSRKQAFYRDFLDNNNTENL